jgi:hypothetical protein
MALHDYLRAEARELATIANQESKQLASDLNKAEQLGNDVMARSLKANLLEKYEIQNRIRTYAPEVGREKPDCPWCWMMKATHSPIKAVPPPEEVLQPTSMDYFRCPTCDSKFGYDDAS